MTKTKAQQIMAATEARAADDVTAAIRDIATEFEPYIIKQRRHFHKHPELSLAEERTTSDIANQLDAMNIPYERPLKTGLVATLRGTAPDAYREDGTPRRRILLRADIDALPVTEQTGEEFASVNEGCMHACGHDCHTAMLLGAAKILTAHREGLHGTVKLLFQMAEEIGTESRHYVEKGALADVSAIFGMHIWATLESGTVNIDDGPRMASSDRFVIKIHGRSAHGSAPDQGKDAIVAAAAVVMGLQTLSSRVNDPQNTFVLTVGMMNGGTQSNIIADEVELVGTTRAFDVDEDTFPDGSAIYARFAIDCLKKLGKH